MTAEAPFVSVIIPVYNDSSKVSLVIESLLNQDYPKDRFEIIAIDNNSSDNSREVVGKYPVTLLHEHDKQSSYAARNLGIRAAKGEIFAFIDSDCIAETDWLRKGVAPIVENQADLVGGRVSFFLSPKASAAEVYDSITYFKFDASIKERKCSGAGNLFVRRDVFDSVGMFPEVKSGGDIQWTTMATDEGFRLLFVAEAVVKHPARDFKESITKALRVGRGFPQVWKVRKRPFASCFRETVRLFFPPNPGKLNKAIRDRSLMGAQPCLFRVWMVAYVCDLCTGFGILTSIMKGGK